MGDRLGGRQRRKLYKPPPPSSGFPFPKSPLLDDEAASSTDLARISAYMNHVHRSGPPLSEKPRKLALSQPFIRSPSPEQIPFNPSLVTVAPNQPPVSPFYPAALDGYAGYGYGAHNALYDSYMRTAGDPSHVPDHSLSCPNSHSSAESSTLARSPTNPHPRSKKSVYGSSSTSHIIRRWSMLHVPDETLSIELENLRRITRMKQRRKSDKAKSTFTHCDTLEPSGVSPPDTDRDQVRFPTKEDHFTHDETHADATLSGAFVYGGPGLRQRFWLADDDEEDARSDEYDISDASDDDSDAPEDEPQTPPDTEDHREQAWKVARKALFCCRELVQTEKTYFSKLVQLKDGQTLTAPPSLLTSYLPALLLASNTLLEHCSQDPTAYGISVAFLASSVQLEHALVAYCGIIGDVFATERANRRKLMRSRRSSAAVDESKRSPPPVDRYASRSFSRKSFNHPSSPQTFFSDRRATAPPMSESSFCPSPSPPAPPPPAKDESPEDQKSTPRRSFSLFKRKSSSQSSSPVPATPKLAKSSWRSFRSPSKIWGQAPTDSNEAADSPRQAPPRPTRPVPPAPQEPPVEPVSNEAGKSSNTLRRHNRSASLQEAHMPCVEPLPPIAWNSLNSTKRGGMSLDLNHAVGSIETSTRSSHNHFGAGERRERVPTVRDLAILPTQRVMRYVLLFKDLLDHTPADVPTRPLIARALDEALRIAEKCDRAQGNAAFLRRGQ